MMNQKGFTLVEILIVISIISGLFVVLIPQVDNAFVKANEAGVKTDFHDFQLATETLLMEGRGIKLNKDTLNRYLDKKHELKYTDSAIITSSSDRWGNPYLVEIGDRKILFASNGKTGSSSERAYVLASYYYQGIVSSCTIGFTHNLTVNLPNTDASFTCGDNLPDSPEKENMPEGTEFSAPQNFIATNITNSSVQLSWNRVKDATQYILKRGGVTIYIGSGNSYSDLTLSPNITYTYEVAARNATSLSSYVSIQVKTLAGPNSPTNFKANSVKDTSIDLSWNAPPTATGYMLYRNETLIYTGGDTSYKDASLTPYTVYHYRLVATNANGASAPVSLSTKTLPNYETVKLPDQGSGSCSPYNPYIITTLGELQGMYLDMDGCFELGNDIDASFTVDWNGAKGFAPIQTQASYFTGRLDGKNYGINNLTINRPNEGALGLFAAIDVNGQVRNLSMNNVLIVGANTVGALAGVAFENTVTTTIAVSGDVAGEDFVGGLFGQNRGHISNSVSSAKVDGSSYVGGMTGYNQNKIEDSFSRANVKGIEHVGGIVGFHEIGQLTALESEATVEGEYSTGGIIGYNDSGYSNKLHSSATVTSLKEAGGVAGDNFAKMEEVYSDAIVTGSIDQIGGVFGYNHEEVSNITSYATVNGNGWAVGGIIGLNTGKVTDANSYAEIKVDDADAVGGVVGSNEGELFEIKSEAIIATNGWGIGGISGDNYGEIQKAESSAKITTNDSSDAVGGMIGYNEGILSDGSSDAIVHGSGWAIGGVIGDNSGYVSIIQSRAKMTIEYAEGVGGVIGYHTNELADVVSSAIIEGAGWGFGGIVGHNNGNINSGDSNAQIIANESESIGGVVGFNQSDLLDIRSSATVQGGTFVGGIIGYNETGSSQHLYSNATVNGINRVGGIAGESVASIANAHSEATVRGLGGEIGGLIGYNGNSLVQSTSKANVIGSGNFVGGVVGYNIGTLQSIEVLNDSFIKGHTSIGGIAGANFGEIFDGTSIASVEGVRQVGGIIGANNYLIQTVAASGTVTGDHVVGGVVGINYNTGVIEGVINTTQVSGSGTDIGPVFGQNIGIIR